MPNPPMSLDEIAIVSKYIFPSVPSSARLHLFLVRPPPGWTYLSNGPPPWMDLPQNSRSSSDGPACCIMPRRCCCGSQRSSTSHTINPHWLQPHSLSLSPHSRKAWQHIQDLYWLGNLGFSRCHYSLCCLTTCLRPTSIRCEVPQRRLLSPTLLDTNPFTYPTNQVPDSLSCT
jgi:hypothetical protein